MEQTKNLEQQNCRHKTITVIRLWAGFSGTIKKNLHMASLFGTCLQETWISNTHLLVEDGTQLTLTEKISVHWYIYRNRVNEYGKYYIGNDWYNN